MAAPIKPSQFEALIVEDTDKLCVALRKTFIQLPYLLWKQLNWMLTESGGEGNISAAWAALICNIDCVGTTTGTDTTPAT